MSARLVVVGDALLDRDVEGVVHRLCPEAPVPVVDEPTVSARPGGAGLAAAIAARSGRPVTLVTALAEDERGRELRGLLGDAGVDVVDLGLAGGTPEKVRVLTGGHLLVRLDRGGPSAVGPLRAEARRALDGAGAVLVSDYGRGLAAEPELRVALAAAARRIPVVWDPHPRGPAPAAGMRLVTPNRAEAAGFTPELETDDPAERAARLLALWDAEAVAVTLGAAGALLLEIGAAPELVPAPTAVGGDPCGAGDCFAGTAASLLAGGAGTSEAVAGAVRQAARFVAAGGAGSLALPSWRDPVAREGEADAEAVVARVRRRGGTVVATGGCFDLLHAGHVAMLEAARALGDCLVVLLNSDESVRRLKGTDRPLVPEEDRAAVLRGLASVDAVVVFDERTPEAALERLRPDVFAKGGDYALEELPEAGLLAAWGGRAVILPYVAGRSTTRLIEEVQLRGA